MKMLFCSQCGAKLSVDAKFCGSCGNPVQFQAQSTNSSAELPQTTAAAPAVTLSISPKHIGETTSSAPVAEPKASTAAPYPASGNAATDTWRPLKDRISFVVIYFIAIIPTYILPYFGSNSTLLNIPGAAWGLGALPQFWMPLERPPTQSVVIC